MNFNELSLIIIAFLSIGGLTRALIGPTVWDRMLGFNIFSSKVIIGTIFIGLIIDRSYMLDVAIIYGLLGFISTIMFARFIERKGDI